MVFIEFGFRSEKERYGPTSEQMRMLPLSIMFREEKLIQNDDSCCPYERNKRLLLVFFLRIDFPFKSPDRDVYDFLIPAFFRFGNVYTTSPRYLLNVDI